MLRAEHVDAFLASAFEVLGQQAQARPDRGSPVLRSGVSHSARELTGLVVVEGHLTGIIFYSMSLTTAVKLHALTGPGGAPELSQLADAVVLQTARTIAAGGVERLQQQNCSCTPGEAGLVYGFGEPLTEVSPVLIVPLYTHFGDMDIGIAMQPTSARQQSVRLISARSGALQPPEDEQRRDDAGGRERPGGRQRPGGRERPQEASAA